MDLNTVKKIINSAVVKCQFQLYTEQKNKG